MFTRMLFFAFFFAAIVSSGPVSAETKFHPLEKLCITYELTGQVMTGTKTRCHRAFGLEWFEIVRTQVGIGTITQKQNIHQIGLAERTYTINLDDNTGSMIVNPRFEQLKKAIQRHGDDPMKMGMMFLQGFGLAPTGETRTVTGKTCQYFKSTQGSEACVTQEEGLVLFLSLFGSVQTATDVSIGDDGGDENYSLFEKAQMQ